MRSKLLITILLFACSLAYTSSFGQYLRTGPGFGYANHSSMPMFNWHVGVGIDLFKSRWNIDLDYQLGLSEGNRNFDNDQPELYWIMSEHHTNPVDNFGGNLSPGHPFVRGKVKTSHSTHRSISLVVNYNWLQSEKWLFSSGIGPYYAHVYKTFIFDQHRGEMFHFFYGGPYEVIYLEPYFYSFYTIHACVATSAKLQLNDRLGMHFTLFYQHMNRFRGLAGVHAGVQVKL